VDAIAAQGCHEHIRFQQDACGCFFYIYIHMNIIYVYIYMISLQYFNEQNVKIIKYGYCDLNLYMIMIYSDVDGRTVD
jgi:hypothetical protein